MARFFTKKTILSSCVSLFLPAMCSAITFQEITSEESGITYVGQSWGASWGDFNGDGWPDLWSSNHGGMPTLYINNKNGGFTDIASDQIIPKDIWDILKGYDSHGSAWADFDNDGDQDLVQLADGGIRFQANHLFINTGLGSFEQVDQAVQMGIDQPLANARTPLWFDWNNDGLLDLMAANAMRSVSVNPPTTLFEQQADGFVSVQSLELDLQQPSSFAMLSDLTGNGEKDIILGTGSSAIRVYSNDGTKLTNITTDLNLAQYKTSQDIALADLTGSLKPELYMVRGEVSNGLELVGDFKIESTLNAGKNQKGLSFSTSGQIYIELHPNFKVTVDDVHIGATGSLPASINFSLSPDDPGVVGMPIYTAGVSHGFYIWFDPANQLWTVYFSSPFYADSRNLVIISDSLITNVQPINFDNNELPKPDYMFVDQGGFYSEQAALHVPDVHNSGRSIVVADFDNDMDMDIYIHRSSPVVNLPNRLYENDGNGNYTAVINAGGAEGTLLGRADTVSTADYNQDGFLDIFLTNGKSKAPFEKDGPYQLFKNAGNNNHWIELDLEGLISNRDGIGATVSLMAGGVTQIREQVGGIHRRTQDHARIHFGLGANKIIDEIKIVWPSGVSQSLHNIKADQIMRIHELAAVSVKGKPMYQAGSENMVYVWKQYYDGPYHIRVNGDGLPSAYLLEMISSEAFTNVVGKKLYLGVDHLVENDNYVSLTGKVNIGEDGVDLYVADTKKTLLAFTRDDVSNPRQLSVGSAALPLAPTAWMTSLQDMPVMPEYPALTHLGMYIGNNIATTNNNDISIRFNTDGLLHSYAFDMFSSGITSVAAVEFEADDVLTSSNNKLNITGRLGVGQDGVDFSLPDGGMLAWTYQHDGLYRADKVNEGVLGLGQANAYQLPQSTPYNQPLYDAAIDAGVYLWKDSDSNLWHLQVTAGGGHMQYSGEIVSSVAFSTVIGESLESSDTLDTSLENVASFNLNVINQWQDGLIFSLPENATFSVNITGALKINGSQVSNVNPESLLFIGEDNWPVQSMPVNIGSW